MQITYKEIVEKQKLIASLLTPEELQRGAQSKLLYAVKRWEKSAKKILDQVQDAFDAINLEFAEEHKETKVLLTDQYGKLQFTREKEALKRAKLRKAEEHAYEFEPYLFTDEERIKDFDEFSVEELKGIFLL